MNVVIEIAGREALPVWTLPNVTGWQLSPNMMLNRLVDSCYDGYSCVFPKAFRVINGQHCPIEQVTLNEIKNTIDRLGRDLKDRNEYHMEWKKRSIEVLCQHRGMYVWLDEFRKWFAHYVCWNKHCHYEPYSLCLYGELAQHFIDNELKIFKQRTTSVDSCSSDNVARNPESVVVGDLLSFTITDLLNKFELVNNDEYEPESDYESNKDGRQENTDVRRGYLYLWQLLLTDETAFVREADYEDEATREAKLKNISDRLKEIKLCLEDCPVEDDSEPSMPNYGEPELLPRFC